MDENEAPTLSPRDAIAAALATGGLADITTRGRRTGQSRRIEIVFFNMGGRVYVSGLPGARGWYANLLDDPRFTFHLKGPVTADLAAHARPIAEEAERRPLFTRITRQWRRESELERFVASSPLIEVAFLDKELLAT